MEPVHLNMSEFVAGFADAPSADTLTQHLAAAAAKFNVANRVITIRPVASIASIDTDPAEARKARACHQKVTAQCNKWVSKSIDVNKKRKRWLPLSSQ